MRGTFWRLAWPLLLMLSACGRGYPEGDEQPYAVEAMGSQALVDKLNRYAQASAGGPGRRFELSEPCRLTSWTDGDETLQSITLTAGQHVDGAGRDGLFLVLLRDPEAQDLELLWLADWAQSVVARDALRELLLRCQRGLGAGPTPS